MRRAAVRTFKYSLIAVCLGVLASCGTVSQETIKPTTQDNLLPDNILAAQNIYSGTRTGGITGARYTAYYDPSIANYGYTGAFDNGRASWNGISSKVAVDKSTSYNDANDFYLVSGADRRPIGGETLAVVRDANGNFVAGNIDQTWHHAQITMYHGSYVNLFSDTALRATRIRQGVTHEIGHSLKQDHDSQPVGTSIMRSDGDASGVTTYNRNELIRKWGQ